MALFGMPRGNATAWVSKPRHRSPPIRPGETSPGPDHGYKILRPDMMSRARHTSPPGKGGEAGLKNDLHPVSATTRTRLHLPSRKPTSRKAPKQPGQIEALDLASIHTPKSSLQKNQKNTLFRSDTTDPEAGTSFSWYAIVFHGSGRQLTGRAGRGLCGQPSGRCWCW